MALSAPIQLAMAQGSTTSAMSGNVADAQGEGLPGATVVAVHVPSGTKYGTVTQTDGRFTIPNMRVGGPYTVEITFIGYQAQRFEGLNLRLGEPSVINAKLTESGTALEEVVVSGTRSPILNADRTGASTNISNAQINSLPTVSRGFNDFVRLTPQADIKGTSISIAGMNNRFNQVTIDGAVSNDVFGLSGTGTNGGSTGTSPISLDAIEQFNVQIAPYDVRLGGFAGGGISAVTRSGTNDFQGSVYYFFRNENLTGKTPKKLLADGQEAIKFPDFTDKQYGVRVGGPIIKNKLFFFLNAEKTDRVTPLTFAPGQAGSEFTVAELEAVAAQASVLGYNPGSFTDQEETNQSEKIFGRLDWNISDKHKLTARYSYTFGEAIQLSRSPRSITFSNGAILRESTTKSGVIEFNSRFSNTVSNNLVANFTTVREPRTAPGDPFPRVAIRLDAQRTINLGTEAFSTVNQLDQNIYTLTDNVTIFKGKHSFTLGTHNELYDLYNAFIGQAFGDYTFGVSPVTDINLATGAAYTATENFHRGLANNYSYQYSKTSDPREGAKFKALQLGLYVQDEYQVRDNLKITGGVRLDVPIYLDEPLENTDFNNSDIAKQNNVKTNRMPKPAFMWSPRIGFNWDVTGDRSLQVRGGTGIFTSRFPFVWAGGAFTQNGVLLDRNTASSGTNAPNIIFNPDPNSQPKRTEASGPGGNITVVDRNFKLPQIFRTNIGIDKQLPGGIVGTAEFMYSKNLNSFSFTNLNLVNPTATLTGADNRILYPEEATARKIFPQYTEIIYIDNVNKGFAWTATAQLQKTFENGFYSSLAYSYTRSKDLFAGTSSQNQSNYYRVPSVNGSNNIDLGFSPFNVGSRIVGAVSYRKEYLNHLGTSISLFYNGQSGTPFSYIVSGDLNRSVTSGSSSDQYNLLYIPNNISEITFVADGARTPDQQAADFNSFIESQDYLKENRGKYAERNGARTPFTHQFDVKLIQDIYTNIGSKRNTLQFTVDVLNVGNLLNNAWGARPGYGNSYFDNTFRTLELAGYNGNTPLYRFRPITNNQPYTITDEPIGGSRWVAQLGFRYIFN